MARLLVIHTSLNGTNSLSSALAAKVVTRWKKNHPGATVTSRDLSTSPIPHLDADVFLAFVTPENERTEEQKERVALSDKLIKEIAQADELVLAVPMYNFGVPSTLRAYFDHIARAGITFRYTAEGPIGMLTTKRVTVVATRGGQYAGTPLDTQSQYLENFFAFLGIGDVDFVYAEGTAMGDEALNAAIAKAQSTIERLPLH